VSATSPFKILPTEPRPLNAKVKVHRIFEELEEVQKEFGFLPLEQLRKIAEDRELHLRDVHAIASYYPHFWLTKPARVRVKVCDDMTCHLRGASALQQRLEQSFHGISDKDLSLGKVSCLGRCDQAPVFEINDCYYDGLAPEEAVSEVQSTLDGQPPQWKSHSPAQAMLSSYSPRTLLSDPYGGQRPYSALRDYLREPHWERLLAELEMASLRGMGGAGFPTHRKWARVRGADSKEKYVVCNADESEPGTIKDRFILTRLPHLVIEGMVLAGLCVRATQGYLYIRHEYQDQIAILRAELERCRRERLIGRNILGTELSFDLDLFVSPGGYICGEESALLEAIEGKRAEPRNRPPLVVDEGLWGKPTVVNNVETLAFAAGIAARCASWFTDHGANGFKGLKFVGISGDVQTPGIYEVPMGTTFYELIERYGGGLPPGRQLVAFAPSGPSSGFLPASKVNLPLDWKTLDGEKSMLGSCAIVVCAEGTCMLDMALNAVRFYRNESCGKCVPCRIGSQRMVEILEHWTRGSYQQTDLKLVEELSHAMKFASICGLGQILPAPIQSVLLHFKEEVNEHLDHRHCRAGVCFHGGQA
jgi:NADH:ubiquinone oxidoreductase subunit F (NADH-binding)/NADH:ubiquinone oxidoreductase subunit E